MRRITNWLLNRYCHPRLYEAISGDLEELYELDVDKYGQRRADRYYVVNSILFLRYHRLRKGKTTKTQNNMSLVKNYVKVSWRDLLRHKTYTSINLIGLVSAMTISLMILQYVVFETGFDRLHADYDRIFRVVNDRYQKEELIQHGTITYPTIGPTLARDYPEIESYTRMVADSRNYLGFNDELHLTEDVIFADEHFLNFFSFETITGNLSTALSEPYQTMLTESLARRLLHEEADPKELVGQTMEFNGNPMKVTGILQDVPSQSHLQFDMLVSYKTFIDMSGEEADVSWRWSDFYHYVKLKEGIASGSMETKLVEFGERYFKEGEVSGSVEKFHFQPLAEAHLDTSMQYEIGRVVNGRIVWTLLIIAGFILLIAWINYVNLTTSRALQRAKEVGVRKSIGANLSHVIYQFMVETLLVNLLALIISLAVIWLLQPFFNQLTGLDLSLRVLLSGSVLGIPFSLVFVVAFVLSLILISIYPATLLAGFQAKEVINGKYRLKGKVAWLRKGLVIFQFVTAIALINGALAISDQVDYLLNKDLGLDIDNTMIVYGTAMTNWDSTFIPKVDQFRNEAQRLKGVSLVSMSNRVAGDRMGRLFRVKNKSLENVENLTLNAISVDFNFEKLYGLKVLEGRGLESTDYNFDPDFINNLIINKTAVKYLGFNSLTAAIGARLFFGNRDWNIVGVIDDFHQLTLREKIEPIVLMPYLSTYNRYSIKLDSEPNEALIAGIQEVYEETFPGNYFDYYFLEDDYQRYYKPEMRLSYISKVFTALSIIMVILGLYGLITMTLEKKIKEIGIRKVLGAKVAQLLFHLTRDFALLMLTALVIGVPLSLYLIEFWKADFAYTTPLGIGSIIIACLTTLVFTSIPILLHTSRVVRNNPVEALRDD